MDQNACPECGESLPVDTGFRNWCQQCGWNREYDNSSRDSDDEGWYDKLSRRIGDDLFHKLANSTHDKLRSRITVSKLGAFLFAGVIHLITVGVFAAGIWLIYVDWFNWFLSLIGGFLILMAWALFPRPSPVSYEPISIEDAPALYATTKKVAELLQAPEINLICITPEVNAFVSRFGWKHTPYMGIGAPLWLNLNKEQKLALIAHELSHQVNNDVARGIWVGSAISSLEQWYSYLHNPYNQDANVAELIAHYLMRLISMLVLVAYYFLNFLYYRDSQKAEYLADYLGSRVSGTKSFIALNERISVIFSNASKLSYCINRHVKEPEKIIPAFVAEFDQVPETEVERVRQIDERELHSLDATHPPTHYRSELLRHFPAEAMFTISDEENQSMDKEVSAFNLKLGQELVSNR